MRSAVRATSPSIVVAMAARPADACLTFATSPNSTVTLGSMARILKCLAAREAAKMSDAARPAIITCEDLKWCIIIALCLSWKKQ
jgi:hypothetical protein